MLSGFNTSNQLGYFEIFPQHLTNCLVAPEKPIENQEIPRLEVVNSERFAELKSFSLKNFSFPQEKTQNEGLIERDYEQISIEDPLYNVLSLRRGQSECYLEDQPEISQAYHYFIEEPTSPNATHLQALDHPQSQLSHSQMSFHYLGNYEESEGESKNLLSTSNEAPLKEKEQILPQTKISTKNVTKNMGKLLFKFIWKNRNSLKKRVAVCEEEWEAFITCIRAWKKENNITREFLNSRWHSEGQTSRLFRKISHQFFRKKCLSAIFQSKIEWKEMHVKRLRRFQDATGDPKALDNLN